MQNPTVNPDGLVTGCLDRDDRLIEQIRLPAGQYELVADSWTNASGYEFEGNYDIAFEWIPYSGWADAPLAEGLTLKRTLQTHQGEQVLVHAVLIDQAYAVTTRRHQGCETVSQVLQAEDDLLGINANFFSPALNCEPTDFLREDGVTLTRNGTTMFEQRTFGWTAAGQLIVRWLPYLEDWLDIENGVGGYPSLVIDSTVAVQVREGEQVYSSTDWSTQPRSALGLTESGDLIFAVLDGRNPLSDGLFSVKWAEFLDSSFQLQEGIGLDGGGSSTLSIRDCWLNDIVNFPSDSTDFSHQGARHIGSGLYLSHQ